MNSKKEDPTSNVVHLRDVRTHKKSSVMTLLKDSKGVAQAISSHICLICHQKKMCVNKTGVCASCYDSALTSEEKTLADNEAKHKIIKITVIDDRWEQ
jgi:hypothetical protein